MNYNILAQGYNELYKEEQIEKLAFIQQKIQIKKSDLLLDIGCGTGISTTYFQCESIGIDPSFEMIQQGKENLILGRAEALPFKDHSFDIILSVTALHNFSNYKKAFHEMKRVLKKKGKIILTLLKQSKNCDKIKKFLLDQIPFTLYSLEKDLVLIYPSHEDEDTPF